MKILDATAGFRLMWYEKECPFATFIDVRPEVHPQHVMDCRKTPFQANEFDMILFDPPHKNLGKKAIGIARNYGNFKTEEIFELVAGANLEFYRILKDDGFLIFKWSDCDIKLERMLETLWHFKPLFGQKTAMRTKTSTITTWVCLVKRPPHSIHDIPPISSQAPRAGAQRGAGPGAHGEPGQGRHGEAPGSQDGEPDPGQDGGHGHGRQGASQ